MDHDDAESTRSGSARGRGGWFSDQGRALVIPIAAMVAVVVLVGMSMAWPVDGQVITAAVVGVLTLAAAAAGQAAGSAGRRDRPGPEAGSGPRR